MRRSEVRRGGVTLVRDPENLGIGRDVRQTNHYSRLKVVNAWQIEAPDRAAVYTAKKNQVDREMNSVDSVVTIPVVATRLKDPSAYFKVDSGVNELILLHGTKPEHVLTILQNGLNERFSHGQFGRPSRPIETQTTPRPTSPTPGTNRPSKQKPQTQALHRPTSASPDPPRCRPSPTQSFQDQSIRLNRPSSVP